MAYTKQTIEADKFQDFLNGAVDAVIANARAFGLELRADSEAIEAALDMALESILDVQDA